jgi:flagellar hook-length control protein FliK
MNASLPVLPLVTDRAGEGSGFGEDLQELQLDSTSHAGFAQLLGQAQAAVSAESADVPLTPLDIESLQRQVQSLPQAGKLLPLLGQLLEHATANGVEARQVVQRIAEKLDQLGSNSELSPGASLVVALQPLLDEIPALKTRAAAEPLVFVSADDKTFKSAPAVDRPTGRAALQVMQGRARFTEVEEKLPLEKLPLNEPRSDANGSIGLNKAREPLRPGQPEPRQADLAGVMETLKRLTTQGKSAQTETPVRPEAVTVSVTSPTAQGPAPATSALATLSVNTPLTAAGWDQALGERIQWMVNQKTQNAQIRLNPAQLGPMEVRVQVQNDQASIQFSSAHSTVREALEAALPRLRELFDASGVELVDVDVSGQSSAGGQRSGGEDGVVLRETRVIDADSGAETVLETPVNALLANGRLDLFA